MLAVLFNLGDRRCGLDSAAVERIVPALPLRPIPGAPPGVAGTFDYRGAMVPVVDLVRLAAGRPARPQLSSRIILARHAPAGGAPRLVGLLAESVNDVRAPSRHSATGSADAFTVVTIPELVPAELFSKLPGEGAAP